MTNLFFACVVGVVGMGSEIGPTSIVAADDADIRPSDVQIEDAPGMVVQLVQAVKDKNWQLVVAMAVMLFVALANFVLVKINVLGDEIRKLVLPWVAAGSGCLVMFASVLLAGGSWWSAALAGFVTGAAATGLWELVFKHLKNVVK